MIAYPNISKKNMWWSYFFHMNVCIFLVCKHKGMSKFLSQHKVPGEMKKRLIKVEAVAEAAETVMLWMAKGLVFLHLPVPVKVGPSLLIRKDLRAKQNKQQKFIDADVNVYTSRWNGEDAFSPTSYDLEILMNMSSALGSLLLSGCLKKKSPCVTLQITSRFTESWKAFWNRHTSNG